jgi:hypothetical protein
MMAAVDAPNVCNCLLDRKQAKPVSGYLRTGKKESEITTTAMSRMCEASEPDRD